MVNDAFLRLIQVHLTFKNKGTFNILFQIYIKP